MGGSNASCRKAIRFRAVLRVTADEIVKYPLIGVDPNDPYGRIMASVFASRDLPYEVTIRARFGSTVCALGAHKLGIAIVDEFTLAADQWPGVRALDIAERPLFRPTSCTARMSRYRAMVRDLSRLCAVKWKR